MSVFNPYSSLVTVNKASINPYYNLFNYGTQAGLSGITNPTFTNPNMPSVVPPSSIPQLSAPKVDVGSIAAQGAKQLQNVKAPTGNKLNLNLKDIAGIAGGLGQAAGSLIGGDYESEAGKAISGMSSLASLIPGPAGGIVGGALGFLGGLANRAFGAKMNKNNIASVQNNIDAMNRADARAASFDALDERMTNRPDSMVFDNKYIGKDGWFSHKAENKANELRAYQDYARQRQERALLDNAYNLTRNQEGALEANYAAFGGELNTQGADFTNGLFQVNAGGSHDENPLGGIPISIDEKGNPNLVEEGETIYNDYVYSNRLTVPEDTRKKYRLKKDDITFAEASKKLTRESSERPNDPISLRGMEAILLELALVQEQTKAKKQRENREEPTEETTGGNPQEVEPNPNEEMAQQEEQPNTEEGASMEEPTEEPMVEEGGENTFAKGGDTKAMKDKELENTLNKIKDSSTTPPPTPIGWEPTTINPYGYFATGYYGLGTEPTWIKNGKYDQDYINYINSKYDKEALRRHWKGQLEYYKNASSEDKKTNRYKAIKMFLDRNPDFLKNSSSIDSWNITDDMWRRGRDLALSKPGFMHPEQEYRNYLNNKMEQVKPSPARLDPIKVDIDKIAQEKIGADANANSEKPWKPMNPDDIPMYDTWMRYAPVVGLGIASLTDALGITNKPNYEDANALLEANREGRYMPVDYDPIGNYVGYTPFDRDYYTNKLNAQAESTRRAIMQNAGMNRGAGMSALLASDYNAQTKLGELARQSEEYNLGQRLKVEEFNRGTDIQNTSGALRADIYNQNAYMSAANARITGLAQAMAMKQRERMVADQAKSANLSNLFTSIGDIGRENMNWNWRNFRLRTGVDGPIRPDDMRYLGRTGVGANPYTENTPGYLPDSPNYYNPNYYNPNGVTTYNTTPQPTTTNKKDSGGKLKKKRKRGLTY